MSAANNWSLLLSQTPIITRKAIDLWAPKKYSITVFSRLVKTFSKRGSKAPKTASQIDESEVVYRTFDEPGVMIDVGAHRGSSMGLFGQNQWRVLAFEPQPMLNKALSERYKPYPDVTVLNCALSDSPSDDVEFYTSEKSTGISSLIAFDESHESIYKTSVKTLTSVLHDFPEIQRIDFLKIDTEGNDLRVLQGMDWQNFSPEVILCEFEDKKTEKVGYRFSDLGDYLKQKGYHVVVSEWFPIKSYGASHRWRLLKDYPCKLEEPTGWDNFIAFKSPQQKQKFQTVMNQRTNR
jgi:FkbM family methyltransferase